MAVNRAKYSEIPKGSTLVSESEALQFQTELIQRWPNKFDMYELFDGVAGVIL